MLSVAREKAEKEGVELILLQQDIAELDFDVPNLDCILCACDGFNYLTYDDELESVFEKAYELLKMMEYLYLILVHIINCLLY